LGRCPNMLIIPAIDLLDGKCVRLHQGNYAEKTEYSSDPVSVGMEWKRQGGEFLHLVDLDGAKAGHPVNLEIAGKIARETGIPSELGGGIRSIEHIESALQSGISRVILGTVAYRNPALVKEAAKCYPGKIVVGIDCKKGLVAVQGWTETESISALELAVMMLDAGIDTFIFTDISRDGTLAGPNFQALQDFSQGIEASVIASGGISSIKDIQDLNQLDCPNITGVIVGKALYDGCFTLKEALQAL